METSERPWLDVPVLDFVWQQRYEFYESDERSSLGKISFVDRNGIYSGGESLVAHGVAADREESDFYASAASLSSSSNE